MSNKRLIVDIETVGMPYESLDEFSREYIEKYAENEEELAESKLTLGFSPLTGWIVAIGMFNPDSEKGTVLLNSNAQLPEELEPGITLQQGGEAEILRKFWDMALHYNEFITFNGRCFDVPFLMVRSAVTGVKPTKNLMTNRYVSSQPRQALHVDLFDQLTFYRAMRTRSSLHFWCKAFGIKSPKEDGTTGDDVGRLAEEGKFEDIARYNLGDLRATAELYSKWNEYFNI